MVNSLFCDGMIRIKNGYASKREQISLLNSKFIRSVLNVLQQEGYIGNYKESTDRRLITVNLRFHKGEPALVDLRLISKPGRSMYIGKEIGIKRKNTFGHTILSTNLGILTGLQAKTRGVGGKVLMEIF